MKARLIAAITLLISLAAFGQNNRSFVSTSGSDANDCTAGHECRSFSRALSVTNYGGEVLALSSGGYGPFTVTQAVSVLATTGAASITATSVDAVDVQGFGGDRIVLRGLSITNTNGVGIGINATGFGLLSIENCSVNGAAEDFLINGDPLSRFVIADSIARASADAGFAIASRGTLVRCRAEKNSGAGLYVLQSANNPRVAATEFVSTGNQHGAQVLITSAGFAGSLTLDRSVLNLNAMDGVFCNAVGGSTAAVFIGNSVATDNFRYGLNASTGGTLLSLKNNIVAGNDTANTNGSIPMLAGQ